MSTITDPPMSVRPTAEAAASPLMRWSAAVGILAVIFGGAIFGFFYAWVCSTMWGLDQADPRVAIAAMQAMNGSVRNAVFFPAFFLTPLVMGAAALLARKVGAARAVTAFGIGAAIYLIGGLLLTVAVNIPMNGDLADVTIPQAVEEARAIWADYSGRWQLFNQLRTAASALALTAAAYGVWALGRSTRP